MDDKVVSNEAPKPVGPYSLGIQAGKLIFCSGEIGWDPKTGKLAQGIANQTARALENVEITLKSIGLSLNSVVKTTIYLTDIKDFEAMNEVYAKYFSAPYPARSTVVVAGIPKGAKVEVDAIALIE
jgi:2-iminobutanoate/2-iminopropanoate deaminase